MKDDSQNPGSTVSQDRPKTANQGMHAHTAVDALTQTVVLIVTSLATFVTAMQMAAVTVGLPAMARNLHMDAVLLSWTMTAYSLGVGSVLLPIGRAADIYGRKKVFLFGMVIFTVFSFLCGTARSGHVLIVYRFLQGAGGAMIFGNSVAILTSVIPPSRRGRVLGINVASVYLGLSIGPFLGGLLTDHLGWRSIFYLMVPAGILVVAAALWRLKGEWAEAKGESFDYVGAVLYAVMLIILIVGVTSLPSAAGIAATIVGVAGIAVFFRRQAKVKHPMFSVELLTRNRIFALSSLAAFMSYAATSAVLFLLSLYLQSVKGMSAKATGIILVSQPVVQTIFTPFAGRLSDRVEPRLVASTGMAITVLGLILFAFCSVGTPLSYIVFVLGIMGLGFALFAAPNANAVMGSVDRRHFGVASGALATARTIGQCLSMSVTGLVLAIYLGRRSVGIVQPDLFVRTMRVLFPIFAGLCVVGVFASLARGRMHGGEDD